MKALKRHSIVITSLAVSMGVHAIGLYFLITSPLMLHHSLRSLFGLSIAAPDFLETLEEEKRVQKNQVIEDIFEHIVVFSPHLQQPFDLIELPRGIAISPTNEDEEPLFFTQKMKEPMTAFQENWIVSSTGIGDIQMESFSIEYLSLPEQSTLNFHPEIQAHSYIGSYDIDQLSLPLEEQIYIIDPTQINPSDYAAWPEPNADISHLRDSLIARSFPNQSQFEIHEKMIELDTSLGTHKLSEQIPFFSHPPLSKMRSPHIAISSANEDYEDYLPSSLADATEWNDDFDLDISFLPNPEGKGYIFSLSLNPNFDISQYSLKHDIVFIIDRSVRKHRYEVYRRAVLKALASLQQGDTFNIYILDKKMTRLNSKSLPVSQKTLRAAEYFLEKQAEGYLFSKGDIYTSLEKILPEIQGTDSIHSAILITDGVSQISSRKQAQVLKNWIEQNDGKISLYTAAAGQQNDLLMLDLLSSVSGGKLLWSDTHASFPRKLAKLILDLRDPVASDLIVDVIPIHSQARIALSSASFQTPVLFSHQPYVIYGSIDEPGPFDLIIQGKHRDQWIAIKKTVCFVDGLKGDRSLVKGWSAQKAHRIYTQFLNEGKPGYLKEAKEILKRSRTEIAFE